jgi:hypothetical protein
MPQIRDIRKFAAEIGRRAKQRLVSLKHELAEVESRKAGIEAHLHSATLLQKRLARFRPEIEGKLQCPRCWVDREMQSSLTDVLRAETEDSLRCQRCGFDLSMNPRRG